MARQQADYACFAPSGRPDHELVRPFNLPAFYIKLLFLHDEQAYDVDTSFPDHRVVGPVP
jgi:hypothetical protein